MVTALRTTPQLRDANGERQIEQSGECRLRCLDFSGIGGCFYG
jgi:hypothetical protein